MLVHTNLVANLPPIINVYIILGARPTSVVIGDGDGFQGPIHLLARLPVSINKFDVIFRAFGFPHNVDKSKPVMGFHHVAHNVDDTR